MSGVTESAVAKTLLGWLEGFSWSVNPRPYSTPGERRREAEQTVDWGL